MRRSIFLRILFLVAAFLPKIATAQENRPRIDADSFSLTPEFVRSLSFVGCSFGQSFNYLLHVPDDDDRLQLARNAALIRARPDSLNCQSYYKTARSLWAMNRLPEAEQMFSRILANKEGWAGSTSYRNSDIPGDTTTNRYGYGSFSSSYKHDAAMYLTKIRIEQRRYKNALNYLVQAHDKYPAVYNCGTGYRQQQEEYDFLYAGCDLGLRRYNAVLQRLLPECMGRKDEMIVKAIRKRYSRSRIAAELLSAEASIVFTPDAVPAQGYTYTHGPDAAPDTVSYISGTATIRFFGATIDMPVPNLELHEKLTQEKVVAHFRELDISRRLSRNQ